MLELLCLPDISVPTWCTSAHRGTSLCSQLGTDWLLLLATLSGKLGVFLLHSGGKGKRV